MEEKSTQGILKEHMIFQKTHTTSLADVRTLNMWGFELYDVSVVENMPNVETISLSLNKISTLKPFSRCFNLKSLFLRQNNIADLNEICYLQNLPNLRSLMLRDNPVAELPNYRSFVAKTLPQLEKLDDIDISSADRRGGKQNSSLAQLGLGQIQGHQGGGAASGRNRINTQQRLEERKETWQEPREYDNGYSQQPQYQQAQPQQRRRVSRSTDDSMLAAVLALIPELSDDSIQIVLDTIRNRKN